MPDHLHTILRGRSDESDLIRAFDRFNLRTSVLLDRYHRPVAWHKNYFDHVIRFDESWQRQASYIALNPIRKGLVEDAFDYPYFYSSLGPSQEVLSQIFWDGDR